MIQNSHKLSQQQTNKELIAYSKKLRSKIISFKKQIQNLEEKLNHTIQECEMTEGLLEEVYNQLREEDMYVL